MCGISIPELQPRLFSFNSPFGACQTCHGLGITMEFDANLVIPDRSLSFNQGAIATQNPKANWYRSAFQSLARHYHFDLDTPLQDLPDKVLQVILFGTDEQIQFKYENRDKRGRWEYVSGYRGLLNDLQRRYRETSSEGIKDWLEGFMSQNLCPDCRGRRLQPG